MWSIVTARSPHYVKDNIKIQGRFTKMTPPIRTLLYEDGLEKLGLWTLKTDVQEPI